jgi:hypothetical protein
MITQCCKELPLLDRDASQQDVVDEEHINLTTA